MTWQGGQNKNALHRFYLTLHQGWGTTLWLHPWHIKGNTVPPFLQGAQVGVHGSFLLYYSFPFVLLGW